MNSIDICQEMHQNFIDFSYEANSQRAFPDARDGLKPGQRACIWEFYNKKYTHNKPHVKAAKISGGVIANWWPHGDTAIYETFVRMSQGWLNNLPEIDWHGNNGSLLSGPSAAAQRYTEARLSKMTEDGMLCGLEKKNVPMILNFSEDMEWPSVLPSIFPRLLVNGSQGIGVTISNTWLCHNLKDISNVIIKYIEDDILCLDNLYPDFPTGGIIINKNEVQSIYKTGKGKVVLRGKTEIKKNSILITELPYQVYVEDFIDTVKELVTKEEIQGINEIYNKSEKKKILIEVECNESPQKVLNKLYALTPLQKSLNANQFALVGKTPKLLNLEEYIKIYINHNIECINNEYKFDLEKAKNRLEIVEGLLIALAHIDEIISLIKKSESVAKAKAKLIEKFNLTENQSKAIVDMRLSRLVQLEGIALKDEKAKLEETIKNIIVFLDSSDLQYDELKKRLSAFTAKYGTPRKTEVVSISYKEEKEKPIIIPEDVVVIINQNNEIKRIPKKNFKVQNRNGKGVRTNEIIKNIISTNTTDTLLVFTNSGRMLRFAIDSIPEGTSASKGISLFELLPIEDGEKILTITNYNSENSNKYAVFVTKKGLVKRTLLTEYSSSRRKGGVKVISLKEDDSLVSVKIMNDEKYFIFISKNGKGICFESAAVAPTGKTSMGIKGINLDEGDEVVGFITSNYEEKELIGIISNKGYGKKFSVKELPIQNRNGKGIIIYKTDSIYGEVGSCVKADSAQILLYSKDRSVLIDSKEIPELSTKTAVGNILFKGENIKAINL